MSACGEADDANPFGVDFPASSLDTNGLERALRVGEGDERVSFGEAVFENDAGDAVLVEPFGDAVAFGSSDEAAISASGADDDGGAVRLFGVMDGERGISWDWRSRAGGWFSRPERQFGGYGGICRNEGEGKDWEEGEEGAGFHDW